jgi:hypothetical protein
MVVWISMFEDGVLPVSPTSCVQEPANSPEDRHDKAALAGEKTYTPRPRHFWRKLRIINYLFWLSAFLALAGYSFQFVNLFADTVGEQVRVALVFYFVVSTTIFTMGFP